MCIGAVIFAKGALTTPSVDSAHWPSAPISQVTVYRMAAKSLLGLDVAVRQTALAVKWNSCLPGPIIKFPEQYAMIY